MFFFPFPPCIEMRKPAFGLSEFRPMNDVFAAAFIRRNGDVQHFMEHDPLDGMAGHAYFIVGLSDRYKTEAGFTCIDKKRLV